MEPRIIAAAMLCMLLSGCSTTHTGSLCTVGPFIPDTGASERWTVGEKRQLVTLNGAGEAICGWKAP
jgi:hypothetical protein